MSFKNWFRGIAAATIALVCLACGQTAMAQTRIVGIIKNEERVAVEKTTSPLLTRSTETGRMSGGQKLNRMVLLLTPSAEQELEAEQLVAALHDASSPSFHKWLTPAEYGQRFGIADADAAQVQQWLQGRGMTVHEVSQSRRFIIFSGTVSQVESAFSTEMHNYTYKHNGKDLSFISNSRDIQIPAALQPVVKGVVRLHSDPRTPSAFMGGRVHFKKSAGHIDFGGFNYLTPADFAKIYNVQPLYDAGIDGRNQTIAIVSRSSLVDPNFAMNGLQDIHDFRASFGLPLNDPKIIVNGDDPRVSTQGDFSEAMLDITWAGAVAPKAQIIAVASLSNFSDGVDVSAAYIVDHNLAPVMSTSFGNCEQNLGPVQNAFYKALWQQAAAEGITSFVSSGDSGGAGCDSPAGGNYASGFAVNGIASTPYNVAVGGTEFDEANNPVAYWSGTNDPNTGLSALGYIPEKVWNDSSNDPTPPNFPALWAGGGGVSTIYAKPDWQTAAGVPNDGQRDLPDFSLAASGHDGYLICELGSCSNGNFSFYVVGGTSASSPAAAGIMALVNQKMGSQPQGLANYVFYRLASIPGVYHDIAKGDNKVPDASAQYTVGYSAGPGYDLASGLGSFDANALVSNWQAASATLGSATTLKLGNGQALPVVHGTPLTFDTAVTCSGAACKNPTGQVSLMATLPAGGVSVPAGVGQLTPGSPTSTVNIQTGAIPGGTYNVTARYNGDGTYYSSSSSPVQVSVTPEPSQTFVGAIGGGSFTILPISITYDEPVHVAVVVAGLSVPGYDYPTGQLTLLADGNPVQTVLGDFLNTPSPMILNYGEKSTILTGGNIPANQSSTISYLGTGLPIGTHHLQAVYPGDNNFSSSTSPGSTSNTYTYTVTKAISFIADFFPVGTPVTSVPVTLAGQLGLASTFCAPFGGTVTATDLTSATPVILGSGAALSLYCDSYGFPVTFTTPGFADPNCPNGTACMHILRIDYSGDGNVLAATRTFNRFPVYANAPSNTVLSVDTPTAMAGSAVTLTALVSSDVRLHPATGTVTFLDGSATLGTATPDANGNAVLVVKTFAGGLHNIIAKYPGDAVLTASDSSGTPTTVTIMDYVVQVFPSALTIQDGSSGTAAFNFTPLGGFAQPVQLSCGKLPVVNVSCSFSKSTVTLDGTNPSVVTLTINTVGTVAKLNDSHGLWPASSAVVLAGLLLPFGLRKRFKLSRVAVCLVVLALCSAGCGGGSKSYNSNVAAAGSFTVNVTATSGGAPAGKAVPLTVTIVR